MFSPSRNLTQGWSKNKFPFSRAISSLSTRNLVQVDIILSNVYNIALILLIFSSNFPKSSCCYCGSSPWADGWCYLNGEWSIDFFALRKTKDCIQLVIRKNLSIKKHWIWMSNKTTKNGINVTNSGKYLYIKTVLNKSNTMCLSKRITETKV